MERLPPATAAAGLRLANVAAYLLMVAGGVVAVVTRERLAMARTPFLPVFADLAAWALIYLQLGVYAAVQMARFRPYVQRIGWLFVLSVLANLGWLTLRIVGRQSLALAALLLLVVVLWVVYIRLFIGRSTGSAPEKWAVHTAFGVYLGWTTVVGAASGAALLVGATGIDNSRWALPTVGVWGLAALFLLLRRSDVFYALAVVWALVAFLLDPARPTGGGLVAATVAALVLVVGLATYRAKKYLSY